MADRIRSLVRVSWTLGMAIRKITPMRTITTEISMRV
jgi:hypothetical protein